jgi:hypothetical protein
VVVKERRAARTAVDARGVVGAAAAKRVRVGAGRRRKEVRSLEAIIAVLWEGGGPVDGLAQLVYIRECWRSRFRKF